MTPALYVFGVLAAALVLFVVGKPRYDAVALLALLALAVPGIVAPGDVFSGFAHPAVVTVAAVLVVSRGLQNAGVVDVLARVLARVGSRPGVQVAALTALVAGLSGFMNNVGALAIMMPVAIQLARRAGHSPSAYLMPIAFGSLLGGMLTLVGTPPNLIISAFRAEAVGEPFRLFDFTAVGAAVTGAGLTLIVLGGWKLVPTRAGESAADLFRISEYTTEVRLLPGSPLVGQRLGEAFAALDADALVVGLVRGDVRQTMPASYERLAASDVLVVEASPATIKEVVERGRVELVGAGGADALRSDGVRAREAVVMPDALVRGRTVRELRLRQRHGVNLIAVARQGSRLTQQLAQIRLQAGDVALVQGPDASLDDVFRELGLFPLSTAEFQIGVPRRLVLAVGLFAAALAATTAGLVSIDVSVTAAALAMVLTGIVPLRDVYEAIEWPVIVLVAAMIPVGAAIETSGGAALIVSAVEGTAASFAPWAVVATLLVVTMALTNVVNNAAAAVLMAPIALTLGTALGLSVDPLLMAVALGASCAFLTPIGHQSNTLVMGPGGYAFGDYWRLGLPLSVLVAVVGVPAILFAWPP